MTSRHEARPDAASRTIDDRAGDTLPSRRKLFGFPVSRLRSDDIIRALLDGPPRGAGARTVITANVDHVVALRENAEFRDAYAAAWLVTADGMPVFLYGKLMGLDIPEKVSGSDLFIDLLPQLAPQAHRPAFLLPNAETREWIERYLTERNFAPDQLFCAIPPFKFENDPRYSADLGREIASHGATHLFIGLGAPKSEVWAFRQRDELGDIYVLAIGASLEFAAGFKQRAPMWMRKTGLEWLWRLLSEPSRLAERYLVRSWGFLPAILADLMSRGERVNLRRRNG